MDLPESPPQLAPCPSTPNCVSSVETGKAFVEPFYLSANDEAVWQALIQLIQSAPRTTVQDQRPTYLYATERSRVFGFIDDIEFILDPKQQRIDVRSASKTGYSDFGVNRRRVESIRKQLIEQGLVKPAP